MKKLKNWSNIVTTLWLSAVLLAGCGDAFGGECGINTPNDAVCRDNMCCSVHGYCGTTPAYCAPGNCHSQCPPPPSPPPPPPSPPPPPPSPPPPSPPPPTPPPPPSYGGECGINTPNDAVCRDNMCCSVHGYCGTTSAYCAPGNCHSQCPTPLPPPILAPPPLSPGGVGNIITEELFNQMLPRLNDNRCPASGFYTYQAFITAARTFPRFGNTGDLQTRTRELAAFFGQTSHETTGGWPTADGGPYAWGYCFVREVDQSNSYCDPSSVQWPCYPGQKYFGRGPIQISYNYNYGQAGEALGLGVNLLRNPDLVATDPVLAFQTAIWFWMTPQNPKPSCHDVIVGAWTPSAADVAANRVPGYGMLTNIINGGLECGPGNAWNHDKVISRIGFFKRYCDLLNVDTGDNLDCADQRHFGYGILRMPVEQA